uniref:Metallothionein-like protein n=1 Tax=Tanacetum cinerariifolium TaxID=118510 RepID=A0A699HLB9_TANCI|nr:metallothionein-like protein type 3 [Tanacetum cinerariifolium]
MKEAADLAGSDMNKTVSGKKGNGYDVTLVKTQKSTVETIVMEVPAAENDGKCKCGANCSCTNCTCGH